MYKVNSKAVIEKINQYSRTFRMIIEFDDGRIINGNSIGETVIEHIMSDDNSIPVGKIISKRTEIKLYSDIEIKKGDAFNLSIYLINPEGASGEELKMRTHAELSAYDHNEIAKLSRLTVSADHPFCGVYIPFGKFIVSKLVYQGAETTLIAYDKLQGSDKIYNPSITFPAPAAEVINDVCRQLGIEGRENVSTGCFLTSDSGELLTADSGELHCSGEFGFTVTKPPDETTCRDILGHIVSMYGRNGILDRNGNFTTIFIEPAVSVVDIEKLDEPQLASSDVKIMGIRCTDGENTIFESGDPDNEYAVEIICPYMTSERFKELWGRISCLKWRPAEIHERIADPCREVGDKIEYKGAEIPVTSLIFQFDGGFSADITACGQLEGGI